LLYTMRAWPFLFWLPPENQNLAPHLKKTRTHCKGMGQERCRTGAFPRLPVLVARGIVIIDKAAWQS
jgi:hypothetical protein